MKTNKLISTYRITSYLLMLGVIHSAMTPIFYKSLSLDALWFFGTGLSLVFLSILNIAASRLLVPWLLTLTLIANIIGTIHSFAITIVLKEFQAFIGTLFFLIVLIACWLTKRHIARIERK